MRPVSKRNVLNQHTEHKLALDFLENQGIDLVSFGHALCCKKNKMFFYVCFLGLFIEMWLVTGLGYGWKKVENAQKGTEDPKKGEKGRFVSKSLGAFKFLSIIPVLALQVFSNS